MKIITPKNQCKGLFWRGRVSSYLSDHQSIEVRKSLKLLKRKSCSGCSQCGYIWEYLQEDLSYVTVDYIPNIKNGKLRCKGLKS